MNPQDTLLNSDYPIDLIVGVQEGSFSVPADFSMHDHIVPHGLSGFIPLGVPKWSTSASFSPSYDETFQLSPTPLSVGFSTSSSTLAIRAMNITSSTLTLYYRVFYLMPSNVNVSAPSTSGLTGDFVINTDYNLTKILPLGNFLEGSSGTIQHNLGYYPQVDAWWEADGWVRKITWVAVDYANPYVTTTPSSVNLNSGSMTTAQRWHYRIYAEEL